ncbi:macro domain protein [Cystoisospora suis]|uniref:Macro domain protein n=1 Tax=Cystoisospora suis TaxID=483139 RepID=A0A2C6LBW6_9APIC|nr:macro domain protein [Cystoisospora suis]
MMMRGSPRTLPRTSTREWRRRTQLAYSNLPGVRQCESRQHPSDGVRPQTGAITAQEGPEDLPAEVALRLLSFQTSLSYRAGLRLLSRRTAKIHIYNRELKFCRQDFPNRLGFSRPPRSRQSPIMSSLRMSHSSCGHSSRAAPAATSPVRAHPFTPLSFCRSTPANCQIRCQASLLSTNSSYCPSLPYSVQTFSQVMTPICRQVFSTVVGEGSQRRVLSLSASLGDNHSISENTNFLRRHSVWHHHLGSCSTCSYPSLSSCVPLTPSLGSSCFSPPRPFTCSFNLQSDSRPLSIPFKEISLFSLPGACLAALPYPSAPVPSLLCQQRFVRPNRGRNDYNQVGGKKRGHGVQILPATLRLLIETRKSVDESGGHIARNPLVEDSSKTKQTWRVPSTYAGVHTRVTEVMRLPTVAQVNSLYQPRADPENFNTCTEEFTGRDRFGRQGGGEEETEDHDAERVSGGIASSQPSGLLDRVVLHVGDISRLRVDATIFGATRSFKTDGDGRGFTGCSQLISGAGSSLPHFIAQQREILREELLHTPLRKDSSSAYAVASAAVDGLRRGLVEYADKVVPPSFRTPSLIPSYEETVKMSAAELADLAGRVALAARTASEKAVRNPLLAPSPSIPGSNTFEVTSPFSSSLLKARPNNNAPMTEGNSKNDPLPPRRLAPPGAVLVTPGFYLPTSFLVQVVEPNAVLSNQQMLDSLFRLEEREAAKRREQREAAVGTSAFFDHGRRKSWENAEAEERSAGTRIFSRYLDDIPDGAEERERGWLQMRLLEDCYVNALDVAAALGVQSVAVPCLGAGVGRFPVHIAARCAARGVARWLKGEQLKVDKGPSSQYGKSPQSIQRIAFCTTCDQEWNALRRLIPRFLSWPLK